MGVSRGEWIALGALALSIAQGVFTLGVIYTRVETHESRLDTQERKMDLLIPKVERIDANVTFLAERAREDRQRGGR
jgi:hypothetical protein